MAMNLRLRPDAERALRILSDERGRSQQDLVRDAVDRLLANPSERRFAELVITSPTHPFRTETHVMPLDGMTALQLLGREEERY